MGTWEGAGFLNYIFGGLVQVASAGGALRHSRTTRKNGKLDGNIVVHTERICQSPP